MFPVDIAEELLELFGDDAAHLLAGHPDVIAFPLPLAAGGALDLVARPLGVAEEPGIPQGLENGRYRLDPVPLAQLLVERPGDEIRRRGGLLLDQLQERNGLRRTDGERVPATEVVVHDSAERRLDVGVEGRLLHLVDGVEGDEGTGLCIGQAAASKDLPEELEQAPDGVVVAAGPGRAAAGGSSSA